MSRAWSFSAYGLYTQCPFKYKLKKIEKLEEPTGPAAQRGIDIHAKGEKYLKEGGRMPKEYKDFNHDMKWLRDMGAEAEKRIAVTEEWRLTDFFGKDVWLRLVIDAEVFNESRTACIDVDFKTGKIRDGYIDQIELYIATQFAIYENLEYAGAELWYLDHGECKGRDNLYTPSDGERLRKQWERKVTPLMNDKKFKPNPSYLCGWCHFRKENGGPCRF